MAFVHGKDTNFQIDDKDGSLTDISAYLTNVDFPQTQETADTTVFTNTARTFIVGLRSATISIQGNWDSTMDAVFRNMATAGNSRTFKFGPAGSGSGNVQYTGECHLTNFQIGAPVGDKDTFNAQFQVTGAVTRTTY